MHLPGTEHLKPITVLGIDPGLSNPGLAIVARDVTGKWSLKHCPTLTSQDMFLKMLVAVSRDFIFDLICCEAIADSGAWKNKMHGKGSGKIVGAEWACKLLALQLKVPCEMVYPTSWRQTITGSGKATKEQVHKFIRIMVEGVPTICSQHKLEAMAVGITGARKAFI